MNSCIETLIQIGSSSNENLAAQVVCYRILGLNKDFALMCMAELARRRELGDNFDYESFIEEEVKKMPKEEMYDISKLSNNIKFNIHSLTEIIKGKK